MPNFVHRPVVGRVGRSLVFHNMDALIGNGEDRHRLNGCAIYTAVSKCCWSSPRTVQSGSPESAYPMSENQKDSKRCLLVQPPVNTKNSGVPVRERNQSTPIPCRASLLQ